MAKVPTKENDSSAYLDFEAKLWFEADKLRNNMDTAESNLEPPAIVDSAVLSLLRAQ